MVCACWASGNIQAVAVENSAVLYFRVYQFIRKSYLIAQRLRQRKENGRYVLKYRTSAHFYFLFNWARVEIFTAGTAPLQSQPSYHACYDG